MTAREEYLTRVRRAMIGMDARVRADILRELAGHIADATAANGGDLSMSLAALGPAEELGRHYRELYGYSRTFKVLFGIVAVILAVPSVPVLGRGPESLYPLNLSVLFLVALAGWLLWVSVSAGSRAGLVAGLAGFVARLGALGVAMAVEPAAVASGGGFALLVAVSGLLILLGWAPGTARKAWSAPRAEL